MTFSELTFTPDQWNEDVQAHFSFQSQWESDNGYLCLVNADSSQDPLTECCAEGQTYSVIVLPPDRSEGGEIVSIDSSLTPTQVEAKINEVAAI